MDIRDNIEQAKEPFIVADEIEKVLGVLKTDITNNKVKITVNSNAKAPVISLRVYVHSILYNLISNALKFRVPGKSHTVEINVDQEEHLLTLSIKDNGSGIDFEQYGDQLFMMYKRLNTHQPGKGLGLYITHYQVEHLGGTIDVASIPGEGTTFTVKIPIAEVAEVPSETPAHKS